LSLRLVQSWGGFRDQCYPDRCRNSVDIAPRCTSPRVPAPHVRIRVRYTGKKKEGPPRTVPGLALFSGAYATHTEQEPARRSPYGRPIRTKSGPEWALAMARNTVRSPSRLRARECRADDHRGCCHRKRRMFARKPPSIRVRIRIRIRRKCLTGRCASRRLTVP
jgi:hypothetical protein